MARFSFRGFVYVLIVMLGLLSAAPNILPQSIKQQLPTWYTTSTLSLGLDLQGGSHLLLAADTNALFEKQLNSFSSDLLSELRSQNVRYTKTSHSLTHKDSRSGSVVFTLRSADDARKVKDTAYQISAQPNGSSALDVEIKQSTVTLTLNELYTEQLVKDTLSRSVEVVRKLSAGYLRDRRWYRCRES